MYLWWILNILYKNTIFLELVRILKEIRWLSLNFEMINIVILSISYSGKYGLSIYPKPIHECLFFYSCLLTGWYFLGAWKQNSSAKSGSVKESNIFCILYSPLNVSPFRKVMMIWIIVWSISKLLWSDESKSSPFGWTFQVWFIKRQG